MEWTIRLFCGIAALILLFVSWIAPGVKTSVTLPQNETTGIEAATEAINIADITQADQTRSAGETKATEKTKENAVGADENPIEEPGEIVILGDSRTVGLYCSVHYSEQEYLSHIFYNIAENYTGTYENTTFVAKGGEGYSWFSSIGVPLAAPYFETNGAIVVWFGVNDLAYKDQYVSYINTGLASFGVPIYYMTVGPCDKHWSDTNPKVTEFNKALMNELDSSIRVIDVNYFIQEGLNDGSFATIDGLHYDYTTSQAVYRYITGIIESDQKGK